MLRFTIVILAVSMLAGVTACRTLPDDVVPFDHLTGCPERTAKELLAEQNQYDYLSDSQALACALFVLRSSEDIDVKRSAFGSRLCLHLAERENNSENREKLAMEGVKKAEDALAHGGENDAAVHYYLAANLGLAVRDQITSAMENLGRLEDEMKKAVALDSDVDDGGPLRLLGTLYLKAPAWPNGIGDLDKALELLERAVNDHPDHPLNHLFYAQALAAEDEPDRDRIKAEFSLGEKLLNEGRWGYRKEPWRKEFDKARAELGEVLIP